MDIDQVFQAILQTGQLMVVGSKEGFGSDMLMDAFYSYYANGAEEPPTALRKAQDYLRDATIEELRMQGWFRSDTYQLLDEESQEFMESLEEKNGRWKPFRKEAFWGGFVCCQCH